MEKRDFGEMVSFFNRKVSEMNISKKCKMELLGMITAVEIKHDELLPKWIPVTEALPEEETDVLVSVHFEGHKSPTVNLPPSDYVEIASHVDGLWSSLSDEYKVAWKKHHVVAWAKLPEPWRGE